MSVRRLLVACGVGAWVGAALWGYKGVGILVTGNQPAHAFEVAPFFFGVSVAMLMYAAIRDLRRPRWLLVTLAWVAVAAGVAAAVAHFLGKEDEFGDLAFLVNLVSIVVLLFLIGGDIRRKGLLARWPFVPTLLAWGLVLALPIGAALEGINERLLEIPLLVVAGVWAMLGFAAFATVGGRHNPERSTYLGT